MYPGVIKNLYVFVYISGSFSFSHMICVAVWTVETLFPQILLTSSSSIIFPILAHCFVVLWSKNSMAGLNAFPFLSVQTRPICAPILTHSIWSFCRSYFFKVSRTALLKARYQSFGSCSTHQGFLLVVLYSYLPGAKCTSSQFPLNKPNLRELVPKSAART